MKKFLLVIASLFIVVTPAFAAYPDYKNYVNDYTNTLRAETVTNLNNELSAFEKQTTDQVAVAMIDTTGDESVEDYAVHLFDQWGPGQKGKDNGVLLLIAKNDHKMRIEVGRGLEGQLTDVQADDILVNTVRPEFKAGNFDAGVTNGVHSIVSVLGGKLDKTAAHLTATPNTTPSWVVIVFIILIIIVGIGIIATLLDDDSDDGFYSGSFIGGSLGGALGSSYGSSRSYSPSRSSWSPSSSSSSGWSGSSNSGSSFGGFGGGVSSGGGASAGW